jgi:His-Xaa-Ser system radical SAM maturase HxsB
MSAHVIFRDPSAFAHGSENAYRLLPFRFARLPDPSETVLLSNDIGDWALITATEFEALIQRRLDPGSGTLKNLRSRGFIATSRDVVPVDLLAARLRTRKAFIAEGPSLAIFVVTLRCGQSCGYCQVSRRRTAEEGFDMSPATVAQAIDRLFELPGRRLTVEFQGGEPALAFDLVRRIVETIVARNVHEGRQVGFTMVSTLEHLDEAALRFCQQHGIALSTSLDGPAALHDANRPHPEGQSQARTRVALARARASLGPDRIAALATITRRSLEQPEAIVDAYLELGFRSVFLRPLSPYGFALRAWRRIGYTMEEYLAFYRRALAHLIRRNLEGQPIVEVYTRLLLRHILTSFPTGYVDLRSPAGAGLGTIVFNYDGRVYVSDEGRMAAETGDDRFCLGDVGMPWPRLLQSEPMRWLLAGSLAEALPGCTDCAFLPFCGADPVFHAHSQGDPIGHRPSSDFCRKQTGLFRILFALLARAEPDTMRVFMAWLSDRDVSAVPYAGTVS